MDWIFDHIQLVIAVAAAFAYWMNARRQRAEEDAAPEAELRDDTRAASDEAERARRIREEIRRKIAERAGGGAPAAPPPVAVPPPVFRREPEPPVFEPAPPRQPAIDTAILEQQRRLQEQLEEVVRTRQRVQAIRQADKPTHRSVVAAGLAGGRSLRADLSDRASLRRAIVLREVIGPPVGLR